MSIVKKYNKLHYLDELDVLIDDTGTSQHIIITDMPESLPQGKSSFLIETGPYMKDGVELLIDFVDSEGNSIYTEPISEYLEGTSRRVSIEVYDDTAPGVANIIVVGELDSIPLSKSSFSEAEPVPEEFQGAYNVRLTREVIINSTAVNTQPIRFWTVPKISVEEKRFGTLVRSEVTGSITSSTFSIDGRPADGFLFQNFSQNPPAQGALAEQEKNKEDFKPKDKTREIARFEKKLRVKKGKRKAKFGRRVGHISKRSSPEEYPYSYQSDSKFLSKYVGGTLVFDSIDTSIYNLDELREFGIEALPALNTSHTSSIDELVNSSTALVAKPFTVTSSKFESQEIILPFKGTAHIEYEAEPTQSYSLANIISYADVTLSDLRVFSGDVYKAKVMVRSEGSFDDFKVLAELPIESSELMVDSTSVGGELRTGYFEDIADITNYWEKFGGTNGLSTSATETFTYNNDVLLDAVYLSGSLDGFTKQLRFQQKSDYKFNLTAGIDYTITFNAYGIKGTSNKAVLLPYISGSSVYQTSEPPYIDENTNDLLAEPSQYGRRLGALEIEPSKGSEQNFGLVKHSFTADRNGNALLQFRVLDGAWYISDVSIKPSQQTGFSPSLFQFQQEMPKEFQHKRPETFEFLVEFYDANNNIADSIAFNTGSKFDGSNIVISGNDNIQSGDMFLGGDTTGSGIHFGGVDSVLPETGESGAEGSGFIRSIGYQGFTSASNDSLGGTAGFMIYSGSVLPDSGENYAGVGLELVGVSGSLKFRTNPSVFDVRADSFFVGKTTTQFISGSGQNIEISSSNFHLERDGSLTISGSSVDIKTNQFFLGGSNQFISGSSGNLEISSSNFHLTNTGDITMSGTITAEAGNLGDFQIIDGKISGSNITLDANNSTIFKTDQGPGSDSSAAFDELRNEYYLDFSPTVENPDNFFVKFGPNFMVDKDGILIASGARFEGSITASTGMIGGFQISSASLFADNLFISGSPLQGGVNGPAYMFISTSRFNVKENGDVTGSNVLFTGGKIAGFDISGTKLQQGTSFNLDGDASATYFISSSNFQVTPSGEVSGSEVLFTGGKIGGFVVGSGSLKNVENSIELDSALPGFRVRDGGGTSRVEVKSGSLSTVGGGAQYIGNKSFEDDSISAGRNFVNSITSWSFAEGGNVNISLTDRSGYDNKDKAVSGDVTLDVVVPAGSGNYSSNNTYEISQVITSSFTAGDVLSFSSVARFSSSFGGRGKDRALGPQYFRLEYYNGSTYVPFLPNSKFTASNGYGEYFLGSGQYNSFGASAEIPSDATYVKLILTGSVNDDTGFSIEKPLFVGDKGTVDSDLKGKKFTKQVVGSTTAEFPETELTWDNFSVRSNRRRVELTDQGLLIYNSEDSFFKMDSSGIEYRGGSGLASFGQSINRESFTNDSQVAGTLGAPAIQPYSADPEDIGTVASDGNVGDFAKGNHVHRITGATINSALSGITLTDSVFNGTFGASAGSAITGSWSSQYFNTINAASITGSFGQASSSFHSRVTALEAQDVDDDLSIAGDSGGSLTIDMDSETLTLAGGTGVSTSGAGNTITFNSVDSEIVHDNLSGFVANEHIDHSGVTLTAGNGLTGGGTIESSRTFAVGAGTGISVAADAVSTNDSEIVHDNLSGFVANEHIDHSSVTLTAGTGLTGGGDITTNRTFAVDFSDSSLQSAISGSLSAEAIRALGAGILSGSAGNMSSFDITDGGTTQTVTDTNTITFAAGEGIDVAVSATDTVTFSGEEASTSNKGVASFSSDNFSVSSGVVTIKDDGVSYAEIQNVSATNRILGRDSAGAGIIEEITPANLRTMINVEDGATADQSAAEIRTLVDSATDSNVFTDDDHTKLDGIEANADVTDTTNVTAAGALMDSELTSIADVKALDQSVVSGATPTFTTTNFTDATNKRLMTDAQETKLDSVESNADVTDTANVTSAGALMDSEVTNLSFVKGLTSGISNGNVLVANAAVADNDFLKIDGTSVEGRTASEVLSDLGIESGATADQTASDIRGLGFFDTSNDGASSGLDADLLDGQHGSYYLDFGNFVIDNDEIPIAKLASDSVSYGGVSVTLGSSDATPAFDLQDATGLPIVAGTTGTLSVARGGTGATSLNNLITLGTHTTGNYVATLTAGTGIDLANNSGETASPTVSVDVSDFLSNGSDNRVVTATGADAMNAEDGLTFDGNDLGVTRKIFHIGDTDTFINFTNDDINIQAGGVNFIDITEDTTNEITFNEEGVDINVRMEGNTDQNLFYLDAGNDRIGIGTVSPSQKLHVVGNTFIDGTLTAREFFTDIVSSSIQFTSGSTKFGDTVDDTHEFTGSVNISAASPMVNFFDNDVAGLKHRIIGGGNAGLEFGADVGNVLSSAYIRFDVGNSEKVRIIESGNVGIGLTNPGARLEVKGADGSNSTENTTLTDSSGNHLFTQLNGGKAYFQYGPVGIGITAPEGNLHVKSAATSGRPAPNSGADELVIEGSGDSGLTIFSGTSSSGKIAFGDDNHDIGRIIYDHSANDLSLWTGGSERVTINGTGVGINQTSPSQALDVTGNVTVDGGSITIEDTGEYLYFTDGNAYIRRSSNDLQYHAYSGHIFSNNPGESFRIDNSGNLLIAAGNNITFAGAGNVSGSSTSTGSFGMVTAGVSTAQAKGKLHVQGSGLGNALGIIEDTVGNANFLIKATAANKNSLLLFGDAASDEIGRIDYDHNDNSLDFVTNSGTALTINNAQVALFQKTIEVLGQNLTHGASRIKIAQESTALSEFRFYGADTSTAGTLRFMASNSDGTGGGTRIMIDNAGRVGIGHASPGTQLDIRGTGAQQILVGSTNAGSAAIILDGDSNGDGAGGDYSYIQHSTDGVLDIVQDSPSGTNEIRFGTAGTVDKVVIDASGRVGIGKTSLSKTLHVDSNIGSAGTPNGIMMTNTIDGSNSKIYMYANNDAGATKNSSITLDPDAQTMAIDYNGNALTIGSSGQVTLAHNISIPSGNLLYLDGGSNTYIYEETADKMSFATSGTIRLSLANTLASFGTDVTVADTKTFGTSTFISGISGDGFRIDDNGSDGTLLEIDNVVVRNTLRTHIFQKDVVKATNGILFVSDSGVISGSTGTTSSGTVTFDNTKSATFNDNDILLFKDASDDGTINAVQFQIAGSVSTAGDFDTYNVDNVVGNLSNLNMGGTAARINGGTISIDASSNNSPYVDVNSDSGSAVVRMGNLAGITSTRFGSLANRGFGIWASGSAYFEGNVNATAGNIGNWGISDTAISSSGGNVTIDASTKRITINDSSNDRVYLGEIAGGSTYGLRIFDGTGTAADDIIVDLGPATNKIAGWEIIPGRFQFNDAAGSIALDATNKQLAIYTGSINTAKPKVVVGNLPTTGAGKYGFAVFSGTGNADISDDTTYSVLITKDEARLAGWDLVPGRLKSGTVADINGNQASIALGTNATSATGTPTDGLFFVSASTSPVFYVGSTFSYVNDVLTAGGWKIGNGQISSSSGNAILSGSGVLSLGSGTHGYNQANRIYMDPNTNDGQVSFGTGFRYSSNSLTVDGNATIAGWSISGTALSKGNVSLAAISSTSAYLGIGTTSYGSTGIFVGQTGSGTYKLSAVGTAGKMLWDNTKLEVQGADGTSVFATTATGATIGGFSLDNEHISATNIRIDSADAVISLGTGTDAYDEANRIYLDGDNNQFSVGDKFKYDGSDLYVGDVALEHIEIDGTSILFRDASTTRAELRGTTWTLGGAHGSTDDTIVLTPDAGVFIYDNDTDFIKIASDGLYVHSGHASNRSAKFTNEISLYGGSDFSVRTLHITNDGINIGKSATGPQSANTPNAVIGNISLHGAGARIYGAAVDDYVDVKSDGVDVVAAGVTQAAFGSTTVIGTSTDKVTLSSSGVTIRENDSDTITMASGVVTIGSSTDQVEINGTSGITIRENDVDTITLSGGAVVVGEVGSSKSNVEITSGAVNLRTNTTNKMTLAADGSITIGSDFSVASGGDVTMTGTITANAGSIGGFKLGNNNIFGNLTGNNAATESNFQIFTDKTGPYIAMRRGFFDNPSYPGGKILMGRNLATDATSVPHTFDGERIVMDGEDTSLKYYSGSGAPDASNPHYARKFKLGSDLYSETGLSTILANRAGNYIDGLPGLMLTSGSIVVDNTAGMPNGDDTGAGWLPPFMVLTRAHNEFARGAHFAMKRDVRKPEGTAGFGGTYVTPQAWDVNSVYQEGLNGNYRNTANFILTLSGSGNPYQGNSTTTFDAYDNYNLYSEVILGSADPTKMYSGYFKNGRFYVGGTESMFNMTGTFSVTSSNLTVDGDGTVTATAFSGTSATLTGTVQAEQITTTDDITLPATGKLYLDGGSHTYIHEVSSDKMDFVVGGDTILELCETSLASTSYAAIQATNKFYLDGGSNTFIQETAGDRIEIVAGGYALMSIKENTTSSRTIIYRDLIINGENNVAGSGDTEDGDSLRLHNNGDDSYIDFDGGSLNIRDDETTVMSIADSLGAVQFGATNKSANSAVRVLAGDSYEAGFEAYGNSQGTGYFYAGQSATYGGGMFYNGDGSPEFTADEFANDRLTLFRRSNGTDSSVMGFAYNADTIYCAGDVIAFYSSDERLKENVIPIGNAIEKIKQIRGVEFDWIPTELSDGEKVHANEGHDVGIIAQEVEKVLPEVVQTRDSGYKAVKYEKIVPLLIESIKEQQEQIDELKKEIKELKNA